jgi:hypothetical protein
MRNWKYNGNNLCTKILIEIFKWLLQRRKYRCKCESPVCLPIYITTLSQLILLHSIEWKSEGEGLISRTRKKYAMVKHLVLSKYCPGGKEINRESSPFQLRSMQIRHANIIDGQEERGNLIFFRTLLYEGLWRTWNKTKNFSSWY